MPSYQVASPPCSLAVAILAVSLGIKPVCFCFNALCRLKKTSILIVSQTVEAGESIINHFDPLTKRSGQTNSAEQQVQWSVSPMTSLSTCQLSLLHPFVSVRPHTSTFLDPSDSRNTQHDSRRVFLSSAPLFEVSRSSDHLAYFIKNTWDAAQTVSASRSARLGTSDASHSSSSPLTGGSWHVPFISTQGHIYLFEWLMSFLQRFIENHARTISSTGRADLYRRGNEQPRKRWIQIKLLKVLELKNIWNLGLSR